MEVFTRKKYRFYLKLTSLHKFSALIFAITYGGFIFFMLQLQYRLGTGDIGSYLHFFNQFQGTDELPELTIFSDGAFRLAIFFLRDLFSIQALTVLGIFAFITSTIISYIFLTNIRSERHLVYLLPLLAMIFTTPIVFVLFSSNVRSGIAFTVLMIGAVYLRRVPQLLFFGLSCIIHFSMIPLVGLYILFHLINNINFNGVKLNHTFTYIVLFFASLFLAITGGVVRGTEVSSSFAYNVFILYVAFLMIATGRKLIKNVYGFMSAGMIFIYFTGVLIDISYSRYFGNALLLYFLFIIQEGEDRKISIFTLGFVPFFLLTSSYMFTNLT